MDTDPNSPSESRAGKKRREQDGLEERAQTATHSLKVGQRTKRRESDGIGGGGTDGNSLPESRAGKKAT